MTMKGDGQRSIMLITFDVMRRDIRNFNPDLSEDEVKTVMQVSVQMREDDPFAALQEYSLEGGAGSGLMNFFKLAPNSEITISFA